MCMQILREEREREDRQTDREGVGGGTNQAGLELAISNISAPVPVTGVCHQTWLLYNAEECKEPGIKVSI